MTYTKWWTITSQTSDNAEILLYGDIGDRWWSDNNSKDFADVLQSLKTVRNITIRVNSPGGEVTAAQAIYSLIKGHPAYVTMIVDGLAASAASLILMAGNRIIMPTNALLMIHNPMIYAVGDHKDMLHAADVLEKVKETMLNVYSEKTGKDRNALSELMDTETWMTATEALQEGFIDEVDTSTIVNLLPGNASNALVVNGITVDLKHYKNMPASILAAVNMRPTSRETEGRNVNADQIKADYPDAYNKIYNAGIAAERERMRAIDSIRATGHEAIINKAKYETLEEAGKVAIDILNAQAAKLTGTASDIAADITASNVNAIPMGDAPDQELTPEAAASKKLIQKAIDAANANMKG